MNPFFLRQPLKREPRISCPLSTNLQFDENSTVGSSSLITNSSRMIRFSDLEKYEDANMEEDDNSVLS
jgi:hypothetical protein